MFFAVSKIFWAIAEPLTFLTLVASLGFALGFTRGARAGRRLAGAAILGLAAIVFTPLGPAMLRPLENRFPPPPADLPAPAGIIVLGGGLEQMKSLARGQAILNDDGMRLIAGLELARRYPAARLIFSGGSGSPIDQAPEADEVRKFWLGLGAPAERMSFEARSRNTWENALFTRDLLRPKPGETWLLVTSAWHMPRSVGIFRRLGVEVTPYPVAYRTFGDARDWLLLRPAVERLDELEIAVREWVGLVAYRLTGKTKFLFPAP
jgi:uncharacterized SAM-binding protein YcdF (DUF218 family)